MILANFTSPSPTDIWTPNIYAIIKDVWVLAYRDQLRLDEYFIMQTTKANIQKALKINKGNTIECQGIYYSPFFKGSKWVESDSNVRYLMSFRYNRHHKFAAVLLKPVNEAYGCPDYKHFPVGA